jgi:tRNA A-37 threonylcarbamoyl transferase component Bud32
MKSSRRVSRLPGGRLFVVATDEGAARDALEWCRGRNSGDRGAAAGEITFAGGPAWCKADGLGGRASLRHSLRRALLRRPVPRLAEYSNLAWLVDEGFSCPEPLAAGVLWRSGLPRWQFLITRKVAAAPTLRVVLSRPEAKDTTLLGELAAEVARLHASGFIHRDLFPRNILVRDMPQGDHGAARRLVFLDTWRGGARWQSRGVAHDIACLLSHLAQWLGPDELQAWFEAYAARRGALNCPVDARKLARKVARQWRALAARYERRGRGAELCAWNEGWLPVD